MGKKIKNGRKAGSVRYGLADKCNIDNTVDMSRRFRKRASIVFSRFPPSAILLFYFVFRSIRRLIKKSFHTGGDTALFFPRLWLFFPSSPHFLFFLFLFLPSDRSRRPFCSTLLDKNPLRCAASLSEGKLFSIREAHGTRGVSENRVRFELF